MTLSHRTKQASGTVVSHAHRSTSPLPMLGLGLALLVFWVLASLLQIQTSEAFILSGSTVSFTPDWSVLMQPIDFVQGHLNPEQAKSCMWGWGMELVFLICIIGYEVAHESVRATNQRLAGWFKTGTIILVTFDGWTDFQYGTLASGLWGQVAFALITAFVVMFFGIIGLRLIEAGLGEWNR